MEVEKIITNLEKKHPGELEYLQAVREVLESIEQVYNENPQFEAAGIIDRLVEPDRILTIKVPWTDDQGKVHVNLAYRVQFNNAIGPYKGKSSAEVMRFCQSLMLELWRFIGPETDVPAGDIGVGGREIGFLYGMYKKLAQEHTGVLTGKGLNWGGSLVRPEATGFGGIYFVKEMLATQNQDLKGKIVSISGFGNVAWGAALKATELGAKVVTISGPDGYIYDPQGISGDKINYMLELRASNQDIVKPYSYEFPEAQFHQGKRPWEVKCDIALPCATQNELNGEDAKNLIANGCKLVGEVSNMGCTPEAVEVFLENKIMFGPGKAVNAGGVATSGLEMSQNSMKLNWAAEEVDQRLHQIMINIHAACVKNGKQPDGYVNYVKGANIAGFLKVANAMLDQGIV